MLPIVQISFDSVNRSPWQGWEGECWRVLPRRGGIGGNAESPWCVIVIPDRSLMDHQTTFSSPSRSFMRDGPAGAIRDNFAPSHSSSRYFIGLR